MKEVKLKEFDAQFDHEFELLKQCEYLIQDIVNEIKKAAMMEEDEYHEERLDELGGCQENVTNGKNKLLDSLINNSDITENIQPRNKLPASPKKTLTKKIL